MAFSLDRFYHINQRILIWLFLFVLIWLLRDFFGLIFLVFVLSFISAPLVRGGRRWLKLPERLAIVFVWAGFALALLFFVRFVAPRVIREANTLLGNLGQIERAVIEQKNSFVERYPSLNPLITGYIRSFIPEGDLARVEDVPPPVATEASVEAAPTQAQSDDQVLVHLFVNSLVVKIRNRAPQFITMLWNTSATLLLALLFGFLIALDTARLKNALNSLRDSRIHAFYEQTAQPVIRFGNTVGRALQAQAVIACINTILTLAGLLLLGVPNLALLALIIFLCSFIPVLGVFISTTPIVLVALNAGGLEQAVAVIFLVIAIHLVEAYVLNPLIYGRHVKLNPVLVLIILFLGHHAFGVWGMILGVPVAHYLIHDVLGVPLARVRLTPAGEDAFPPVRA